MMARCSALACVVLVSSACADPPPPVAPAAPVAVPEQPPVPEPPPVTAEPPVAQEAVPLARDDADAPADPGPDPASGSFTLDEATAGLAGTGALVATIKTSSGDLECKLLPDKAPVTVANFVGLARGLRPFKSPRTGRWEKTPAYDGSSFHRVIKGFMIQGGDPTSTGKGEPGYTIADEIWPGGKHDRPGLLCMANRGPNTNGMQFFVTDASAPHLDGNYTIFGECSPVAVVHAIAAVPVDGRDRPLADVEIRTVEIRRSGAARGPAAPKAAPPAPGKPSPAPRSP